MKNILTFLLVLFAAKTFSQKNIHLIPQPVEVIQANGKFTLTSGTAICFNNPDAATTAASFAETLNRATGYKIKSKQGKAGNIQLNLNKQTDPMLGQEGYTLEVSPKKVIISANQTAGLFYGVQTFLQLLPKEIESVSTVRASWTAPAVKIRDYPRLAWRGLMLDVSRHFFTKEEVKRYIDEMSRFKFNVFHWHLTDDQGWRIEIKSLPKLTEVGAWRVQRYGRFGLRDQSKPGEAAADGGFYTQDDIREIVKYAQERNVTIVPEIDVPGHSMAAVASYPELCCTKDTSVRVNPGSKFSDWYGNGTFKMYQENTLNPSDEKVYEFLDKVFTEVAALFPGKYIHVGGDECYKGFWQQDSGCIALMKQLNIRHVEDLQGYFMNRVENILKSKGKKLLGWDEILDGGISPEAALMSWRGMKSGIDAAAMGHEVVMSPTSYCYLDYCQGEPTVDPPIYANLRISKCYSFEPVPEGADSTFILGGQGNLWTEQVATFRHVEYMIFPRAWALSEVFWSPRNMRSWATFVPRMEYFFERFNTAGVNYSKAVYDAIVQPFKKGDTLWLKMNTEIPGLDIYYTIDESMPDDKTVKYTGPVQLPEGPITLRVITYRDGKPIGHLITLKRADLESRAGR